MVVGNPHREHEGNDETTINAGSAAYLFVMLLSATNPKGVTQCKF